MSTVDDWLVVGRFGRVHGIKGYITIISFTEPRDNIFTYKHLHAYISKQWQPLKFTEQEITVKNLLVRVDGYPECNQAANLTNIDIGILKQDLPGLRSDEYYWHELIGMSVITKQDIVLGKVVDMLSTGANDVLIVEGERRHLIPYLPDQFVINISRDEQRIIVDWDKDF